jgi:hypothetical protein
MCDLRQLASEFIESGWYSDRAETEADEAVIKAVNERDRDPADRRKSLVEWLSRYRVFRGLRSDSRTLIAGEIIAFADERHEDSLHRVKNNIIAEFNKLRHRISAISPRNETSLASKALWCCYPNDVPIFDRNAASALRVISRVCHLAPEPNQEEYASFVDVWLQVYNEIEPAIDSRNLCDCPYGVRMLDRLLWYLGRDGFYQVTSGPKRA